MALGPGGEGELLFRDVILHTFNTLYSFKYICCQVELLWQGCLTPSILSDSQSCAPMTRF